MINQAACYLDDQSVSKSELASLLAANLPASGLVDRLKVWLRPYVCPFDLLLRDIEPGLAYYDIGCGSGAFLRILAEYKRPTALGGVDVSERLISNATSVLRSCSIPIRLRVYEGLDLPAESQAYDYLFLIDVLHHMPLAQQAGFLERLSQRMKPGQRLIIKDIDAANPLVYWNKFHDLLLSGTMGHEQRADRLQTQLEQIGLVVKPVFLRRVLLYPHYAFLCTRPQSSASGTTS